MLPEAVKRLPEVELGYHWWLDFDYRGGVDKRVGGWDKVQSVPGMRTGWWVVVFREGTRSRVFHWSEPANASSPA